MVKKISWKVQFQIGKDGRTQEEYINGLKRKGKPTKAQAKDALLNRPAYMMTPMDEINIKRINKNNEYTADAKPAYRRSSTNIPGL